jgi:voltage-gated potassium channel
VAKAARQATANETPVKKAAPKQAIAKKAPAKQKSPRLIDRVKNFLDHSDFGYMVLGFAYLGIYSAQVLLEPEPQAYQALEIAATVIYVVFVIDLALRIWVAGKSLLTIPGLFAFLRTNWLAVAATLLPAFRSLRVLRVIVVLRGLAPYLSTRASKVGMVVGVTLPLVLYTAALSVLEAERYAEGANITNFTEAIWWSIASVTTVGYGDRFPITPDGRTTATLLLMVGIGLFSALTALLAAWVMGERNNSGSR